MIESCDNWYLFQKSDLKDRINQLYIDENDSLKLYVYEDLIYTDSEVTMSVYKKFKKEEMTVAQHKFNLIIIKIWVFVEHSFEYV